MTYKVFSGTLNLTQSINQSINQDRDETETFQKTSRDRDVQDRDYIPALEDLDQSIVQLANYNSLYFFAFSDRHLRRLHCMQVIKAWYFVLDWSNLIWLCDHSWYDESSDGDTTSVLFSAFDCNLMWLRDHWCWPVFCHYFRQGSSEMSGISLSVCLQLY